MTIPEMEQELKDMKRLIEDHDRAMGPCGVKGHERLASHLQAMRDKFPDHWMFSEGQ